MALNIAEKDLLECSYCKDISEIGELYLELLEVLYGGESERQLLKRYIDWTVFETATEPELENYNYDKWHKAIVGAVHQLQILYIYQEKHPESYKAKEYIAIWEKRINAFDINAIWK